MLTIGKRDTEEELTVFLSGELDHHETRRTIEQAEDYMALYPSAQLTLDLTGLTFMDSSGLAVVMHLFRTAVRSGREFLVRGAPPQPMRVFEAAGLPQIMDFEGGQRK